MHREAETVAKLKVQVETLKAGKQGTNEAVRRQVDWGQWDQLWISDVFCDVSLLFTCFMRSDKCSWCCFPRRLETQKPPCESQSRIIMNPPGKSTTCSWPESPDVGASSISARCPFWLAIFFIYILVLGFMCVFPFLLMWFALCTRICWLMYERFFAVHRRQFKQLQDLIEEHHRNAEADGDSRVEAVWITIRCDTMVVQLRLVSLVACCVFGILVSRQWIIGSRTAGRSVIRGVWYCGV